MNFFKQRLLWIGVAGVTVLAIVFGLALMGSIAGAKPKEVPVALAVLDQGAQAGGGQELNAGQMIRENLLALKGLPVSWQVVSSEEEARAAIDRQDVYGALIIPADLSQGLLSLASPNPKPAALKILVNEGSNAQAALLVQQVLGQAADTIGAELAGQVLAMAGQQTGQVPVEVAKALLAPVTVEKESLHAAGANNAGGNAPTMLIQVTWLGSLFAGVFLFLAGRKAKEAGSGSWAALSGQAIAGLLLMPAVSGLLVWMASSWYGMEMARGDVWLYLWLTGTAFFLLQSALLNLIGVPAVGLLALLFFFSMPVLNLAPEFLPDATKDWLYSWTPLRYAAQGLRSLMYFGGEGRLADSRAVLWWLAGICFAVLLASGLLPRKAPASGRAQALS
ncbi:YhgE/Pip domain-containing protein [Cohnella zeiphila]|uniref:ABC transporter permease n=1 Tax=Cohnella zeiphila TaxID=2761120 RepID=A0A7X0VVG7_9BACL|nr:ABC transporter permease [Cohnella zeiphila]MBB6731395.1 ABC transporter permease [Cohnella zeiphila]